MGCTLFCIVLTTALLFRTHQQPEQPGNDGKSAPGGLQNPPLPTAATRKVGEEEATPSTSRGVKRKQAVLQKEAM